MVCTSRPMHQASLGLRKPQLRLHLATLPLGAANEAGLNSRSRLKLKLHGTISNPCLLRGLLFAWSWHPWLFRPKGITKRQVERCIHEVSEHWSDVQLNDVIDIFQAHGLL